MKTLKAGNPEAFVQKWWIGKTIGCERCGGLFELEATDSVTTLPAIEKVPRHGEITCPTAGCNSVLWVPKE